MAPPNTNATAAAMPATVIETRAPQMRRLSRSRPSWSVPSRYPLAPGIPRRRAGAVALGSRNGNSGATTATSTISATSAKPNTSSGRCASQWRRERTCAWATTRATGSATGGAATSTIGQPVRDGEAPRVTGGDLNHAAAADRGTGRAYRWPD